jgi:hypothetical protein
MDKVNGFNDILPFVFYATVDYLWWQNSKSMKRSLCNIFKLPEPL